LGAMSTIDCRGEEEEQGRGGGAGERRRSRGEEEQAKLFTGRAYHELHIPPTHTPTHFDGLLSQSWDGVSEPRGHVGKDLVIHSGGLEVVDEMFQLWREGQSLESQSLMSC